MKDKEYSRNYGLDFLRLVAAFFIVILHVNIYSALVEDFDFYIKALFRWCVPFFFVVTGFYLCSLSETKILFYRVKTIFLVCFFSNLIYFPLYLIRGDYSWSVLYQGFWFHLWFLNSMFFGLFVIWVFSRFEINRYVLYFLSVIVLFLYYFFDIYSLILQDRSFFYMEFFRSLQSLPLILLGVFLNYSFNNFSRPAVLKTGLMFLLSGSVLTFLEIAYFTELSLVEVNPQFPLGSVLIGVGLILVALTVDFKNVRFLASLGRKYSLFIYIFHPLFLYLVGRLSGLYLGIFEMDWLFISIVVFVLSLYFSIALVKYFPLAANAISGKVSFFHS